MFKFKKEWTNTGKEIIGITVVALICICTLTVNAVRAQVNKREIPIYCVDTTEKKIALSFDAAWATCRVWQKAPKCL